MRIGRRDVNDPNELPGFGDLEHESTGFVGHNEDPAHRVEADSLGIEATEDSHVEARNQVVAAGSIEQTVWSRIDAIDLCPEAVDDKERPAYRVILHSLRVCASESRRVE